MRIKSNFSSLGLKGEADPFCLTLNWGLVLGLAVTVMVEKEKVA